MIRPLPLRVMESPGQYVPTTPCIYARQNVINSPGSAVVPELNNPSHTPMRSALVTPRLRTGPLGIDLGRTPSAMVPGTPTTPANRALNLDFMAPSSSRVALVKPSPQCLIALFEQVVPSTPLSLVASEARLPSSVKLPRQAFIRMTPPPSPAIAVSQPRANDLLDLIEEEEEAEDSRNRFVITDDI